MIDHEIRIDGPEAIRERIRRNFDTEKTDGILELVAPPDEVQSVLDDAPVDPSVFRQRPLLDDRHPERHRTIASWLDDFPDVTAVSYEIVDDAYLFSATIDRGEFQGEALIWGDTDRVVAVNGPFRLEDEDHQLDVDSYRTQLVGDLLITVGPGYDVSIDRDETGNPMALSITTKLHESKLAPQELYDRMIGVTTYAHTAHLMLHRIDDASRQPGIGL